MRLSRITTGIAAAFSLLVLASPALALEKYTTLYKAGSGGYAFYVGQSESAFISKWNQLSAQGSRISDVEAYLNASGDLRYSSVWEPASGGHYLYVGIDLSTLNGHWNTLSPQGFRITSLSSYRNLDGERRYTVVFRPGTGAHLLSFQQTQSQLISTWNTQSGNGLRISVLETYLDDAGVRRYDTVWRPGTSGHAFWLGMSNSGFTAKVSEMAQAGLRPTTVESYQTTSGAKRYDALFTADSFAYSVHTDQTYTELVNTWNTNSGSGLRLYDVELINEGTDPSWSNYGSGLGGTNGVPALTLSNDPIIGLDIGLTVGNSRGSTTLTALFLGVSASSVPLLGGSLLVNPLTTTFFNNPGAGVTLPATVSSDPTLDGVDIYLQVAEDDPGAVNGVSLSRGLKMTFGRIE